jgi:hypothetical protein
MLARGGEPKNLKDRKDRKDGGEANAAVEGDAALRSHYPASRLG